MKKALAVIAAALTMVLVVATPASATSSGFTGSLIQDQQVFYTNGRTITVGGSHIFVQKTDGPHLHAKWYKCGNRGVSGAWIEFENADPTARKRIGSNFLSGTVFCLAAWSHGNNATDTWSGTIWWNVFS
jgi:hypothetical protein